MQDYVRAHYANCVACGTKLSPPCARGRPRSFCADCRLLRLVEQNYQSSKRWRMKHPDKAREHRRARHLRDQAAGKYLPRAERVAASRKRAEAIMPKIQALLDQGLPYAEIGPRLGLTRNAVAGLVHRNRK